MSEVPFSIVRAGTQQATEDVVLVRAIQTTPVCPAQWDAWDAEGRYYYLCHRSGRGSVDHHPSPDPETWDTGELGNIAHFEEELPRDIEDLEELAAFCELAGIRLADDVRFTTYAEYLARGAQHVHA